MSAPQATAPYDPLTAEARSLLFKTASYLSQEDKQRLEKACAYAFCAHELTQIGRASCRERV